MQIKDNLEKEADLIERAGALLITAGAGMGVDSGLPDFRGNRGFWRAYPALGAKGLEFEDMANPRWFEDQPRLAWGFYGHRLQLYRATVPHAGFQRLRDFARDKPHGAFVYTSNVDGQFQKAGFQPVRIVECHGSLHHLQCTRKCTADIWPADGFTPDVDEQACLLRSAPPTCPACGGIARPNVLMFSDWSWVSRRTDDQHACFQAWRRTARDLVVIELGAGIDLPTIRRKGENLMAPLIRINPTDAEAANSHVVSLPMGALNALQQIQAILLGKSQ